MFFSIVLLNFITPSSVVSVGTKILGVPGLVLTPTH